MQLAGHMRGQALQEWDLLDESDKATFTVATQSLRSCLDPGSRALAAQDFRHTVQGEAEPVADFIRRLELFELPMEETICRQKLETPFSMVSCRRA